MKLIRAVVGVVAVLFSIQPLVSWAANTGKKVSKKTTNVQLQQVSRDGKGREGGGNPTCGGGL